MAGFVPTALALGAPPMAFPLHPMVKKRAAQAVAAFLGVELPEDKTADNARAAVTAAGANGEKPKKKRRSRWNTDDGIMPKLAVPTVIPSNLSKEERDLYLKQLRIEELSQYIRVGFVPPETDRSPSPEPVYNQAGQRLNTRELRYKLKWETERHNIVQALIAVNPNYRPPVDYRPPDRKIEDRITIPQDEYPDINFMGLIIGPRGKTLKKMESETGAKIMIRGRGSVKEGKGIHTSALLVLIAI